VNSEEFIEHHGVKGMRWGVRKSHVKRNADARKKKMGVNQLKSEKKLVDEFGGGLKGTLAARRYLVDTGQLSISDVRKGNLRIARNVTIGLLSVLGPTFLINRKL
jgi:hypothetical protein